MKTFTITALLVFAGCLQAIAQANVTFAAPGRYKITVAINGRTQTADQYVRLEGLPAGDHEAKITLTAGAEIHNLQSTVTLPDNQETSYFVLVVGNAAQIHWANETRLDVPPPQANTPSRRSDSQFSPYQQEDDAFEYRGQPRRGNDYGNSQNGSYGQQYPLGGYYTGGTCDCNNRNPVISPMELERLRAALQRVSFDDDKLRLIGNTVRRVNLMTDDVRLLMASLSFDSSRLRLAKMAFNRTCDQRNYHTVNSAFDYQSSARELQRHIKSR